MKQIIYIDDNEKLRTYFDNLTEKMELRSHYDIIILEKCEDILNISINYNAVIITDYDTESAWNGLDVAELISDKDIDMVIFSGNDDIEGRLKKLDYPTVKFVSKAKGLLREILREILDRRK